MQTEIRPDLYLHHNSHLADLKSLTHDALYETYRTEKLSRTVHMNVQCITFSDLSFRIAGLKLVHSDTSILPEELATQSVRLKEEQLRREEEKVNCVAVANRGASVTDMDL